MSRYEMDAKDPGKYTVSGGLGQAIADVFRASDSQRYRPGLGYDPLEGHEPA